MRKYMLIYKNSRQAEFLKGYLAHSSFNLLIKKAFLESVSGLGTSSHNSQTNSAISQNGSFSSRAPNQIHD